MGLPYSWNRGVKSTLIMLVARDYLHLHRDRDSLTVTTLGKTGRQTTQNDLLTPSKRKERTLFKGYATLYIYAEGEIDDMEKSA